MGNNDTIRILESQTLNKGDIAFEGRLVLKRLRTVYRKKFDSQSAAGYDSSYWLGYVHGAEEMLCDILGSSVDLKYDSDTDTYTFEIDE